MEKSSVFEVVASSTKTGIGRNGKPYVIEDLTVNFNGRPATVRKPKGEIVNVGDRVRIQLAAVKGFGMLQVGATVAEVIPAAQKGEVK